MCKGLAKNLVLEEIKTGTVYCSIHTSFEDIEHLQEEWDSFVESVGGDIYFSYTWCHTWWEFYGEARNLRIFIYRRNNVVIGLIPIFFEKQWLGPTWLKIAKIVGSDFTMVIINPPVVENYSNEIYKDIINNLFQKDQCDALLIGPTSQKYIGLQKLRETLQGQSNAVLLKDCIHSPYTTFILPEKFEEYFQSLSKNQRGDIRKRINLINRSFNITQDIIQDDETATYEFYNLSKMHNEQWKAQGKLGHFNDWPKGAEFNAKLVSRQAQHGRLRLIKLSADQQAICYLLCYAFGKRWHWRISARVLGPVWDKFALGKISLIKDIETAIAEGVQEIEAGSGHYDYKIKLGGEEHPLYTLFFARNQVSCRCRAFLFLKLSNLLHFLYYRVWFSRLAPKLPFKRRPLWPLWIRTRI
jgi:CelD/BcsL family acetyltransferase involved in cellulose biosynthesis